MLGFYARRNVAFAAQGWLLLGVMLKGFEQGKWKLTQRQEIIINNADPVMCNPYVHPDTPSMLLLMLCLLLVANAGANLERFPVPVRILFILCLCLCLCLSSICVYVLDDNDDDVVNHCPLIYHPYPYDLVLAVLDGALQVHVDEDEDEDEDETPG